MKCVVCDDNADYVSGGSSYCKKHLLKDVRIGTESSESNDKIIDEQKAMEKEPLDTSEGWGSTS